jgi:hypothetical protein
MPWTRDNLETFIEFYRSFPCLWKIKSDDYKNRNSKNRAYQKLVDLCKTAVWLYANKDFVVKKKIKAYVGPFVRN